MAPTYQLVRPAPPAQAAPVLDDAQARVVAHAGGPLLVLAGPGTGKTTTLVEAVAERVRRGLRPEQVLVLTFSRKAADELRERIVRRLGRTVTEPAAYTFHAFCAALVSSYGESLPRLLSGPERLTRIRELLLGNRAGQGTTRWPDALGPCLATRGFATEVADFLDRARERGLTSADLQLLARSEGRADWQAVSEFMEEYAAVLGGRETDYAELVSEALRLLETDLVTQADVRERFQAVFVDEYQDTDPAQERLLQLLAGDGRDLVVVGDPDQSIYGFRGADVSCLLRFPERFPKRRGEHAPVVTLEVSRRAGAELLTVSRRVAERLPAPGLPVDELRRHRALRPGPDIATGAARIDLFATETDEATAIADLLRRAHLDERLPWSRMAVLVRSAVRSFPVLRRTLIAAGVPVTVATDELPVARDPAVAPLLLALRAADEVARPDRGGDAKAAAAEPVINPETVLTVLQSPLVRATPAEIRRLGRALRAEERTAEAVRRRADPDSEPRYPRPSAELIAEAVREPQRLVAFDDAVTASARRLVRLLAKAADALTTHGSAAHALWALWEGSGWPRRLADASYAGGQAGRSADRDLDAVGALFDAVARTEERNPLVGVTALAEELEAQEIPSQSRAEGRIGADAVRLLTAHRSKGLEWDLVVVAGVQDGVWPDVRRRGSVLEADRITADGVRPPATAASLLVEERRLFYVACTRARQRLYVTAVRSLDDAGARPSRFLDELGLPVPEPRSAGHRLLSTRSLVGRLRRAAIDPDTSPAARDHAAAVLARLAAPIGDGRPAVTAADPDTWWGLAERTPGARPVRDPAAPVALSASAIRAIEECPLAWFLQREAAAATASSSSQGFGLVLHALARLVSTGALPPDADVLVDKLDTVWHALGFEAAWLGARDRDRARDALGRLLLWVQANSREHLGSEVPFTDVEIHGARLSGSADRLDRDADGGLHIVDYKTSTTKPTAAKVAQDLQLGVYQVVAREGGFAELAGEGARPAGAELVQLVHGRSDGTPAVQEQSALPEGGDTFVDEAIKRAVARIGVEAFPARPNERCATCSFARACPAQDAGRQVVA